MKITGHNGQKQESVGLNSILSQQSQPFPSSQKHYKPKERKMRPPKKLEVPIHKNDSKVLKSSSVKVLHPQNPPKFLDKEKASEFRQKNPSTKQWNKTALIKNQDIIRFIMSYKQKQTQMERKSINQSTFQSPQPRLSSKGKRNILSINPLLDKLERENQKQNKMGLEMVGE